MWEYIRTIFQAVLLWDHVTFDVTEGNNVTYHCWLVCTVVPERTVQRTYPYVYRRNVTIIVSEGNIVTYSISLFVRNVCSTPGMLYLYYKSMAEIAMSHLF
jgi:hypothetical protein